MNNARGGLHHISNSAWDDTHTLSQQMLLENVLVRWNGAHIGLQIPNHRNLVKDSKGSQSGMLIGHTMNHGAHTHESMGMP